MSSVRARKSLTSQAVVCLQVGDGGEDEPPEAMDVSWPSGFRKRITYVLLAPIVFPLWLTLPDTRAARGKFIQDMTEIIIPIPIKKSNNPLLIMLSLQFTSKELVRFTNEPGKTIQPQIKKKRKIQNLFFSFLYIFFAC